MTNSVTATPVEDLATCLEYAQPAMRELLDKLSNLDICDEIEGIHQAYTAVEKAIEAVEELAIELESELG